MGTPTLRSREANKLNLRKGGGAEWATFPVCVEWWDYKASGAPSALITRVYSSEWLQIEDGGGGGERVGRGRRGCTHPSLWEAEILLMVTMSMIPP